MTAGLLVPKRLLRLTATCWREGDTSDTALWGHETSLSSRQAYYTVHAVCFVWCPRAMFSLRKPGQWLVCFRVLWVSHSRST